MTDVLEVFIDGKKRWELRQGEDIKNFYILVNGKTICGSDEFCWKSTRKVSK